VPRPIQFIVILLLGIIAGFWAYRSQQSQADPARAAAPSADASSESRQQGRSRPSIPAFTKAGESALNTAERYDSFRELYHRGTSCELAFMPDSLWNRDQAFEIFAEGSAFARKPTALALTASDQETALYHLRQDDSADARLVEGMILSGHLSYPESQSKPNHQAAILAFEQGRLLDPENGAYALLLADLAHQQGAPAYDIKELLREAADARRLDLVWPKTEMGLSKAGLESPKKYLLSLYFSSNVRIPSYKGVLDLSKEPKFTRELNRIGRKLVDQANVVDQKNGSLPVVTEHQVGIKLVGNTWNETSPDEKSDSRYLKRFTEYPQPPFPLDFDPEKCTPERVKADFEQYKQRLMGRE
jgi:hypothetical protein